MRTTEKQYALDLNQAHDAYPASISLHNFLQIWLFSICRACFTVVGSKKTFYNKTQPSKWCYMCWISIWSTQSDGSLYDIHLRLMMKIRLKVGQKLIQVFWLHLMGYCTWHMTDFLVQSFHIAIGCLYSWLLVTTAALQSLLILKQYKMQQHAWWTTI